MEAIYNFDFSVFTFFEEHLWNPVLDVIMTVISTLGDGGIIWIAVAVCLLISKKYRKYGIMMAAGLVLSVIFTDGVFKNIFDRPRPYNYAAWGDSFVFPELVEKLTSTSFPSGHTSSSFAAAVPLFYCSLSKRFDCPKYIGIPAIILAVLIGVSRIYVHVHYCTDVLGGLAFGVIYGICAVLIIDKLLPIVIKKVSERKKAKA